MKKANFNPIFITKRLLTPLDNRQKNIIQQRFGLGSEDSRTLESIGREYGITRERVRQIESFALGKIRQSEEFSDAAEVFLEMAGAINELGGIVQEDEFLNSYIKNESHKPHVYFLLVAGNEFKDLREDEYFHRAWATDENRAKLIKNALGELHESVDEEKILSDQDVFSMFGGHLQKHLDEEITDQNILSSILKISKLMGSNVLGEWGVSHSPYIRPRGMRDYAFLVMRKHGSPMHFSEVAKSISDLFVRAAHVQTVHNELIKDERFVLVGRGLYALKEWGYEGGVVRNVITKVLTEYGPLVKDDIIKKVLKERYVKENTILVNLQNRNYFKRNEEGYYALL